jgi:two-component system alkaline phosphatase synthesis response regulator PhoP
MEPTRNRWEVVLVEPDQELASELGQSLASHGFEVLEARDRGGALQAVKETHPDVIVIDLANEGGVAVRRDLRDDPETARLAALLLVETEQNVENLRDFAVELEDFVVRSASPGEVAVRTAALLQRAVSREPATMLRAGGITMDLTRRAVSVSGSPVRLTAKEFELLQALLSAKGETLSREDLAERTSDSDVANEPGSRRMDVHISRLRRKLVGEGRRIITVRDVGYRFDLVPEWIVIGDKQ